MNLSVRLKKPEKPLSCTKETSLKKEDFAKLYRFLKITRMFDEITVRLKRQAKITGGVFSSLGQEATAVGTCYALEERDFIAPLIRDIGACFVKGILPREIFASYLGRATSPNRGTDLQFHFADLKKGFIGPISHLGDMVSVMAGVLLASKMRREDRVAIAYVGEGATSTGAFHEGINFAAVQKLPLIVVVENNGYAYSTPTHKQCAAKHFVDKAVGYGILGLQVDGNDVVACYETAKKAVEYARSGNGSVLIEAITYRRKGHAEHDNQSYVPPGEIEWWAEHNDPIKRFELFLTEENIFSKEELLQIEKDVAEYLEEELTIAESAPSPEPITAAYDVFDNSIVPPAFKKKFLES
ncbi:MAG: thiamine pyrophosphate-dependent dehydrogenase E1 component subunit alpha [Acidobacteria bacterium]|jgi:pyruvate dehydrogenase E1 component alpha subunit/2-oxoisovalerate dehydrogenase E1 component alpha subunit|nr:MAG: thiamine pyrophosphate-dependent dehydrogenase E1 component subunit alpha [Acidobacteriota bacterium]GIU81156.1 MAG: pyruvate dehydrogenase [Pyrinomonadaceae bacterium]